MGYDNKLEAWRSMGSLCVQYGVIALAAGMVFSRFFSFGSVFFSSTGAVFATEFIAFSAIFSLLFFSIRTARQRDIREVSVPAEASVAGLAAIGLSLPLLVAGLLLTVFARPQYEGVERWLPEVKDRHTYELQALQTLVAELELSQEVQEGAENLLEELHDRDLMRGRELRNVVAATVYIVAREEDEPRTLEEISEITGAPQRELGKAYRFIGRNTDARIIPPHPGEYLDWFVEKLDLSQETSEQAEELLEQAHEKEFISGKSPKGLAASALYLSAYAEGEDRTMKEISDVLDVTTVTLRQRSREFVQELGLEDVPENLTEHIE